jgi:hypothetical protein
MEPSIWSRIRQFVQQSFTEKFKYCLPGCIMGLLGAKSLLFAGLPAEMVTLGAYVLKYVGTVLMAFGSGLATAYAAYLIDQYKNKKNVKQSQKRRKKGSSGGTAA